MLTAFGPDIWISDGDPVSVLGFSYPTRMVVVRLPDKDLWIWSPVALDAALYVAINKLGRVGHIVAPNHLHHLSLADWHAAFPAAKLHAAPRLARKRRDLTFATTLGDTPDPAWAGAIDQTVLRGNLITTEIAFFHRTSGTLLFTDILQHFPQDHHTGLHGVIARADLMVGPEPAVPRKFRAAWVNRRAARDAIAQVRTWPATCVVMAHGTPVTRDTEAFLIRAFAWL